MLRSLFLSLLLLTSACGSDSANKKAGPKDSPADITDTEDKKVDDVTNHLPSIQSVTLSPSPAFAASAMVATPNGWSDADGDAPSYNVAWRVNGVVDLTQTGLTYPAGLLKNDTLQAEVTPKDAAGSGAMVASALLTISNSKPSISSVTLSPALAFVTSAVTATHTGWADADNDAVEFSVAWFVDGTLDAAQTTLTYPAGLAGGKTLQARITPKNGSELGTAVASSILTITTSKPSITSVSLSPSPGYATSAVVATPNGWSDPDGDSPAYNVVWRVNGVVDIFQTGLTYPAGLLRDDTLQADVTPKNGTLLGTLVSSAVLTIADSKPSISSVTLTPSPAYITSLVTATPNGWNDADGDSPAYDVVWRVNGTLDVSQTGLTYPSGLLKNDTLKVEVTPKDASGSGTMVASAVLTISNSLPTITSVTLSPSTAYVTTAVTATPNGWADADGDAPDYNVVWHVDGTVDVAQTTLTYPAGLANGKTLQATITPKNGAAVGTAVSSSVLTISNSRPIVSTASFTPNPTVAAGQPLNLGWTASDPDGAIPPLSKIRWRLGGVNQPGLNDQTYIPYYLLSSGSWDADVYVTDGGLESVAFTASGTLSVTAYDPAIVTGASLFDLTMIRNAATLNATLLGQSDCPGHTLFVCYDVRFESPMPYTQGTLTTAAWVVLPKTVTKPLGILISLHGSGGSRDRDASAQLAENYTSYDQVSTRQLGVIAISGPGEEGSNGPSINVARYYVYPDPRMNWDYLYAYVAMRTITYARNLPIATSQPVDIARIGMTGVSAGGTATLLSNGVENRLALALPLSATGYFAESASLPNSWMSAMATLPATYQTAVEKWIDPKAYLATQSAPTKIVNGAQDEFFPIVSTRLTFNAISASAKSILMLNDWDHYYYYMAPGRGESSYDNRQATFTKIFPSQGLWSQKYLMDGSINPAATPTTSPVVFDGSNVTVQASALALALPPGVTAESRTATLYASSDNGYTFTAFAMSQATNTFTYTGAQSGVWLAPAQTVWFVEIRDQFSSPFINGGVFFDVDYRSTLPVYPAGFQQALRPVP